jgi:glutamine amidotransferase
VENASDWQHGIRTVLPGVGAFKKFMHGLSDRGFIEPIINSIQQGIPLLGICVGMQALFEQGEEMGFSKGLGLIAGNVIRFADQPGLKVPHTGWNTVTHENTSRLLMNIASGTYFYFNHSYYCQPIGDNTMIGITDYIQPYASIVQVENAFGVQFHPEKSQSAGLLLLKNFMEI